MIDTNRNQLTGLNATCRWLLSILLLTISPVIWSSGGETIESWGKEHYETHGKGEGRTLPANRNYAHYVWQNPGLLLAYESTLDSDKGTKTCHGDYVRNYPDLNAAYTLSETRANNSIFSKLSSRPFIPIDLWGKWHYRLFGKVEQRAFCDNKKTRQLFLLIGSESCYGDYVRKNSDLLDAYISSGTSLSVETWGKSHYQKFGKTELRIACKTERLRVVVLLMTIVLLLAGVTVPTLALLLRRFLGHGVGLESGIYVAVIIVASGLINWSFGHSQFAYVSGAIAGPRSAVFLTWFLIFVGALSFLFRWFWNWNFRKLSGVRRDLPINIQRLGIFIFILGVFYGPSVTMYLIVCYLAFAPLFADDDGSIKADNLFITIAFGFLMLGLLFALISPILGENRLVFVIPFIVLAVINVLVHKHRLVPVTSISSYPYLGILCLLFFAFGGTVLMGSLLMGFGEYPQMFLNSDTPVRLTHAHELVMSTSFPPEMLTLKGFSMPYQYGGPAAVAALSVVARLAVHKSMFHVALPVLLIGSFSAIHLLCRSIFKRRVYRCISISLFLPFVYLGTELFTRVFPLEDSSSVSEVLVGIGREFTWLYDYETEKFTEGVWDITQTTGLFLLILASLLLVKRKHALVLISVPLLVVLVAFSKLSILPAVCSLLAVRVLASFKYLRLYRFLGYVVISSGLVILGLYVFGVFKWAAGNEAQASNLFDLLSILIENLPGRNYVLIESIFVMGFAILFIIVFLLQDPNRQDSKVLLLWLGSLACAAACFLSVSLIEVFAKYQIYQPVWICLPLICIAMLSISSGLRFSRTVVFIVTGPLLVIAVMGGWIKLQQFYVLQATEGLWGHDHVDNRPMAQALLHIPKKQSHVATNNFKYLGKYPTQYQITAIFGHQAYSVDTLHLRHNKELQKIAIERIREQVSNLKLLHNHFYTKSDANLISSIAAKNKWTHILYKKHKDAYDLISPVIPYRKTEDNVLANTYTNKFDPGEFAYSTGAQVSIKRAPGYEADLVSCGLGDLTPDGLNDNIFEVEIRLPNHIVSSNPEITFINLYRENPEGRFHTRRSEDIDGYAYSTLGIGLNNQLDLINNVDGKIQIPVVTGLTKLLLFTCADLGDIYNSHYFVKAALTFPSNAFVFSSPGDKYLRKIFENQSYKLYEF